MFLEDKNPGHPITVADNRRAFVALLRDPSRWPQGFRWDYDDCRTCGMGLLACTLLHLNMKNGNPDDGQGGFMTSDLAKEILKMNRDEASALVSFLGFDSKQAKVCFYGLGPDATPNLMATFIEGLLY